MLLITALIMCQALPVICASEEAVPAPAELLQQIERSWNPLRIAMVAELTVEQRDRAPGTFRILLRRDGPERVRVDFLAPVKDEGKVMLLADGKTWLYLPRADRLVAVSPRQSPLAGMMFSDLFPGELDRYDAVSRLTNGFWELQLTPKKSEKAAPARIFFDPETRLPLRREVLTPSGTPLKTIIIQEMMPWQNTVIPKQMKVIDRLRGGMETTVAIVSAEPLAPGAEVLFTKESLGQSTDQADPAAAAVMEESVDDPSETGE